MAADYFYDAADQRTATVGVIDRDQGRQKFYDIDIYFVRIYIVLYTYAWYGVIRPLILSVSNSFYRGMIIYSRCVIPSFHELIPFCSQAVRHTMR